MLILYRLYRNNQIVVNWEVVILQKYVLAITVVMQFPVIVIDRQVKKNRVTSDS